MVGKTDAGWPRTEALKRALGATRDWNRAEDLIYLENWESSPVPGLGAATRVGQIRRANPVLAAEIRAELDRGRPLTEAERQSLAKRLAQPLDHAA